MSDRPLFCDHKHKIIKATENNISTSCSDCMTRFQWVSKSKLVKARAEVGRLTGVLRGIRDSDETNAVRLQNMAGVAIGKADEDQNE